MYQISVYGSSDKLIRCSIAELHTDSDICASPAVIAKTALYGKSL